MNIRADFVHNQGGRTQGSCQYSSSGFGKPSSKTTAVHRRVSWRWHSPLVEKISLKVRPGAVGYPACTVYMPAHPFWDPGVAIGSVQTVPDT